MVLEQPTDQIISPLITGILQKISLLPVDVPAMTYGEPMASTLSNTHTLIKMTDFRLPISSAYKSNSFCKHCNITVRHCNNYRYSCVSRTIPESLVWLLSKGRIKEAEDILERAAAMNKKTLPPNCLSDHENKPVLPDGTQTQEIKIDTKEQRTYTVIDLFRTPRLRKISICICMLWWVIINVRFRISAVRYSVIGRC